MKFKEFDDKSFMVKRLKPEKVKDINPKTNRMKTFKRASYMKTDVPMKNRTLKNLPRYADKKPKVHFKDWMGIKMDHKAGCFVGKAESTGEWMGWSHRAIAGFKVGDTVKADTCGNETGKEYVIKTDDQARQTAINFAKDVA